MLGAQQLRFSKPWLMLAWLSVYAALFLFPLVGTERFCEASVYVTMMRWPGVIFPSAIVGAIGNTGLVMAVGLNVVGILKRPWMSCALLGALLIVVLWGAACLAYNSWCCDLIAAMHQYDLVIEPVVERRQLEAMLDGAVTPGHQVDGGTVVRLTFDVDQRLRELRDRLEPLGFSIRRATSAERW